MSRKTPIKELIDEEVDASTASSRRRSTRIAAVVTRRASASEETVTPAKVTRGKRLSLSQESNASKDDDDKSSVSSTQSHGRATRAASKSPQTKAKASEATEANDVPAKRTRRRASTSSIADEDRSSSPAPSRITRRSSARFGSVSPTSEPPSSKPTTPLKSTRSVSASPTPDVASKPISKLRGRRSSVTQLESIQETEVTSTDKEDVKKQEKSEETPVEDNKDIPSALKKKGVEQKQNLQTIAETSFSEESQDIFKSQVETEKGAEEASKEVEDINNRTDKKSPKKSERPESSPVKVTETKAKSKLSVIQAQEEPDFSEEEEELKLVLDDAIKSKKSLPESEQLKSSPTKLQSPTIKTKTDLSKSHVELDKSKLDLDKSSTELNKSKTELNKSKTELNKSKENLGNKVVSDFSSQDESFHLTLEIEESESLENIKAKVNGKTNLDTSGSSNASDKENQQLLKTKAMENKPSPKLDSTKKKWLSEFNSETNTSKTEDKNSPAMNKSKLKVVTEISFYEPMDVDEYPSGYLENSIQQNKEVSLVKNGKDVNKSFEKQIESPATSTSSISENIVTKSPSLLRESFNMSKINSDIEGQENIFETPDKLSKSISKSETDILKVDISSECLDKPKVYSVTTESPKLSSPVRRSARLIKQSVGESPETEKDFVNSTPKQKPQQDVADLNVPQDKNTPDKEGLDRSKRKSKSISESDENIKQDQSKVLTEENLSEADKKKKRRSKSFSEFAEENENTNLLTESVQTEIKSNDEEIIEDINISSEQTTQADQNVDKSIEDLRHVGQDKEENQSSIKKRFSKSDKEDVEQKKETKEQESKRTKSGSSENSDSAKHVGKSKSLSESKEKLDDLSQKINELIAKKLNEDESSDEESVTDYLDDMAEEGEEDTPSEGSNDIIDEGESIGSTESEIDSDETYELDSFIDDNEENELLSGEEYDLDQDKKPKKKRKSRIIPIEDSDEEALDEKLAAKKDESVSKKDTSTSKQSIGKPLDKPDILKNGIEEDSDMEKMSTRPYCGLTPPSVVSLRDSLSDTEDGKVIDVKDEDESVVSVLINQEDNLKSLEELKEQRVSDKFEKVTEKLLANLAKTPQEVKTTNIPIIFTPNNSLLEVDANKDDKSNRKRLSSITIQENISLKDIEEGNVSDRISKVVDVFCSSVKKDVKDTSGNISVNISLDYVKSSPTPSDDGAQQEKEVAFKRAKKNKSLSQETLEATQALESSLEKHVKAKKLALQELQKKQVEEKELAELEAKDAEDNEEEQRVLSKKQRKKKKRSSKNQEIRGEKSSAETNESADEELAVKKKSKIKNKKSKDTKAPVSELKSVSDSEMSEDLDKELYEKYSSGELSDDEEECVENEKLNSKKSKKVKHKLENDEEPQVVSKKIKKSKILRESDGLSDEVFIEQQQKPDKVKKSKLQQKLNVEEIKTPFPSKTRKKEPTMASETLLFKSEKSSVEYFPSSTLQELTKTEKQPNINKSNPSTDKNRKPKLVPSSDMGKRSWECMELDLPMLPSTSSTGKSKKKKKGNNYANSFPEKDFKNRILFDAARVKREDTKTLLKKKKKANQMKY